MGLFAAGFTSEKKNFGKNRYSGNKTRRDKIPPHDTAEMRHLRHLWGKSQVENFPVPWTGAWCEFQLGCQGFHLAFIVVIGVENEKRWV